LFPKTASIERLAEPTFSEWKRVAGKLSPNILVAPIPRHIDWTI
jgi:hypothetical protein